MFNETKMLQIGVNKSVLKEYTKNGNRTVYMENGKEFQLNLFNPTSDVICASIWINGEKINNDLVLNPGERAWIERYLDKPSKFRFETYEVEAGNAVVDNAIKNNGEITVRFYKEKKNNPTILCASPNITWYNVNDIYYDGGLNDIRGLDTTLYCSSISGNVNSSALCASAASTSTDSVTTSCSTTATSSLNLEKSHKRCANLTKETGRVNEGGYSNQSFKNVNKEFEYWSFTSETIQIMPMSEKPYTVADTQKVYCSECGHKLKTKYKFCPYCGAKID